MISLLFFWGGAQVGAKEAAEVWTDTVPWAKTGQESRRFVGLHRALSLPAFSFSKS